MEISEMTLSDITERMNAIRAELETADDATLDRLNSEVDELEARKQEIEQRKTSAANVAGGAGTTIENYKERNSMTLEEIRNSHAYNEAYANYIRTGDASECRALLTDNTTGGTVPVPTMVAGIVAEAYKQSRILARVRKTNLKGNVKIGFERSAPVAGTHTEGGAAIAEEELLLGIVTLIPSTLKKWVSISDESLDSASGEAYLEYVYTEIMRKVIAAEENMVVAKILAAPQTATATAPAVKKFTAQTAAVSDFINARALLSSDASDLVILCTPAQYAQYKTLALAANFAFDPFEGIEVLFNDTVTMPIIGDLSGVMVNEPNGNDVAMKYDDTTLATSDLVRVIGRKPVAVEVVANNYFAKIGA